jgi:hypothetical protein
MNNEELQKKLDTIKEGMKWFESIVHMDYKTEEGKLTKKQAEIVQELFTLFKSLNWQLRFNNYKEINYEDSSVINKRGCGTPVKIRPCKEECGNKTYFGILLGEMALSIGHTIDDNGNVLAKRLNYNPAIFVPELNDIIYGCESWWGKIKSEEELKELITDETIKNVWYVKLLNQLDKKEENDEI